MRTLFLLTLIAACAPRVEYVRVDSRAAPVITSEVGEAVLRAGPPSEFSLMTLLNGEPVLVGVLTSSGSSVNETTTAVTFTVVAGTVYLFKCDTAQANVGGGTTCDTTVTNASHKVQLANAWDPYYLVLKSTHICLDAPPATTINCAVFRMQGP